jgi:toxic protein SymE
MEIKQRRKIYSSFNKSQEGKYKKIPQIRLEGKWLEELGFQAGGSFLISHEKGKITIELEDKKSIGMEGPFEKLP